MITLKIENSICKLSNLQVEDYRKLRSLLSYKTDPYTRYLVYGINTKKHLIDKHGVFPTGLLYIVLEYFTSAKKELKIVDTRIRPQMPLKPIYTLSSIPTPYPEQIAAVEAIKAFGRGIVSAPTGTGKSLIIALAINALQVRTLVVVPTLELKRQLSEFLEKIFDTKVGKKCDIWVENIDSLFKTPLKGYDCVIIDEFHHSGAKSYRDLNLKAWNEVYYKIGLTATPFRSQDNERLLLESVLSRIIYRLYFQLSVASGYIVPIEAYYFDLPKIPVEGYSWAEVYHELIVANESRNRLISDLLGTLHSQGKATLCLVKEIAHGEALSALTGIPFAHGGNEETPVLIKGFNDRKLTCLIGTTGILGEGIDTKPCEYVIIAGLGKSKNQFMQNIGRGVRRYEGKESAKVILFKDLSHKWTISHYKTQVKILKEEYGVIPVKLN